MARTQGVNSDGTPLTSFYTDKLDDHSLDHLFYVDCSDSVSLTRQEFADDCDINTLMDRYEKTGTINHFNNGVPQYLDVTELPDLQGSLEILAEAQSAFMRLPAVTRREFDNDPTKFVDFASNPDNLDKMREWGLAAPAPTEPPPQKVEIINPPQSEPTK